MIISHRHRFVFLKTNKTAGTSVEIALSQLCGESDIITPISPNDEGVRRELGGRGPQNHLVPFTEYGWVDLKRLVIERRRGRRFYNHMPAEEVRPLVEEGIWEGYYKFCFERNPWDRTISQYYWVHKGEDRPPLSEFIGSDSHLKLKERGWGVYTIDNQVVVDRVLKFESLEKGLREVCRHLGVSPPPSLPHTKGSSRTDRRHYREILDEGDREKIAEIFADEIRICGYEF